MKNNLRVLIAQPYGIGDTLFLLPLVKALKKNANAQRVDLILGSRTSDLARLCPYVDAIHVVDKDLWKSQKLLATVRDKIRLAAALKKNRYDIFIDLSMQAEYGFWALCLGIPLRAGFNYKNRNRFLNRPLSLSADGFVDKNIIEYYVDLGKLIGVVINDKKPELRLWPEDQKKTSEILAGFGLKSRSYIVLAPGGGATWGADARLKHWPVSHFARLTELLRDKIRFDAAVVIGSGQEEALGAELKKNLNIPSYNLCGKTSLVVAAGLIQQALLFLGNDGGLTHIASSLDTPLIALSGPPDVGVYGPYPARPHIAAVSKNLNCQPCYKKFRYNQSCPTIACLRDLTPENVLAELEKQGYFKNIA